MGRHHVAVQASMVFFRSLPGVLALSLFASPSLAGWETVRSEGRAKAAYRSEHYELSIQCRSGQGFELRLDDLTMSGDDFQNISALMMWIELPDGRTDRWPVDVVQEDAGLSGELLVSDFNLEFFRNGQSFELDSPQTRKVFLSGDMRGTAAARFAFSQQCKL